MAKLTLAFKDRKLKIFAIPAGESLIGRNPECWICIDSLAVEPLHARVTAAGELVLIEPCEAGLPVLLNGEKLTAPQAMQEGDTLVIGKHTLSFSEEIEGTVLEPSIVRAKQVGWLQILSGSHLGRTIRLDKTFTRIGKSDTQLAVIARRDDGFHLSHLLGDNRPTVNDEDVGDSTRKLNSGDEITVGELRVQFFPVVDSEAAGNVDKTKQRQFSRIPFDVPATLCKQDQRWETTLIDISLHGALVQAPDGFENDDDRALLLQVHLQGGPDINIEVTIAHQEDRHIGLSCRDIDVDSITYLRRLVELNLGDPELVEREISALGTL